jgi:isopenicillin-N epimerase
MTNPWRPLWALDPAVIFLNHGSHGACPNLVLDKQQQLRARLESNPVSFFRDEYEVLLDQARDRLGQFLGAAAQDLVFVPNATTGVNTVLKSLPIQADWHLLTTNQTYNACRNALDAIAQTTGARVVVANLPWPVQDAAEIIQAIIGAITPQTKLALLDHVVSQTALILPLQQLVPQLSDRGIETLIDGAHAPGMIELNLSRLGATYYTGNCHKWLSAPKGAAFLYVQRDRQPQIRPLVISHGANSPRSDRCRFLLEFDWTGTADPTPYLSVPLAIDWISEQLGWPELMASNHQKVIQARNHLCQTLGITPPSPDQMLGSMAALPINANTSLQTWLMSDRQIEVPVFPWQNHYILRVSAQIYNQPQEYEILAQACLEYLKSQI